MSAEATATTNGLQPACRERFAAHKEDIEENKAAIKELRKQYLSIIMLQLTVLGGIAVNLYLMVVKQ